MYIFQQLISQKKKIFDTLVFNSLKRKLFLMRKKKSGDTKDFFITIVKRLTSFFFHHPLVPLVAVDNTAIHFQRGGEKNCLICFFLYLIPNLYESNFFAQQSEKKKKGKRKKGRHLFFFLLLKRLLCMLNSVYSLFIDFTFIFQTKDLLF